MRPPIPALVAATLLLSACGIITNMPRFIDSPTFPKPPQEVLGTVLEVMERQGFRVQFINEGEEGKEIGAQQVQLSPFNKQGVRRTATAKVSPVPDGTIVRVMVEKEINSNIMNPLDEVMADWGSREFDSEMEELLLSLIGMKVMPAKVPPGTPTRKRP
jgi:hypothetical protein